jgi:hypothetical protein
MPEATLEQELRALGPLVEFPATPDLATAVRRRLTEEPARRQLPWRRTLVLAFALLAVTVGALMAVPQSRTAILEWLGIRGVEIERVPTQPTAPAEPIDLGLGERVTLGEARARADFDVLRPGVEGLAEPDEVYVSARGAVAFVYRDDEGGVATLLTQFRGFVERDLIHKSAGPETTIEAVRIDDAPGWWIAGEPHEFVYLDETGEPVFETLRLAGNTLLWTRGDVSFRLEGDLTKREAIEIAESMG